VAVYFAGGTAMSVGFAGLPTMVASFVTPKFTRAILSSASTDSSESMKIETFFWPSFSSTT
jgi:hypothetical protein